MAHTGSDTPRCSGPASEASADSRELFADPDQTLVFFDWDDTLFPTTELFARWGVSARNMDLSNFSAERLQDLRAWENALYQYLSVAATLSTQCCIVTNARRPWIAKCVERFAPKLQPLLGDDGVVKVVYARELLADWRRRRGQRLRPVRYADVEGDVDMEREKDLLQSKFVAMKRTAQKFYSRYPGQSWKNIISIGDMRYEHDAAQEVAFHHTDNAGLRIKTFIVPGGPELSELTLRLQFDRLLLPAFVRYDGDIDVNLREEGNPVVALGSALDQPEICKLRVPLHAWGMAPPPKDEREVTDAFVEVAAALQEHSFA